mmetsp:Transcript_15739/g.36649  ORF Transcript_15739/g.36649 Transcript_15739/m.36649 type:complete len:92 (-) Transcript_15739:478-753(-)
MFFFASTASNPRASLSTPHSSSRAGMPGGSLCTACIGLACDQLPIFWKICSRVVEQAPSFNWRRYYHHYVSEMEESDESDECDADWESSEE